MKKHLWKILLVVLALAAVLTGSFLLAGAEEDRTQYDVPLMIGSEFCSAISGRVPANSLTKIVFALYEGDYLSQFPNWESGTDVTADESGYVRAFAGTGENAGTVYVLTKGTKFVLNEYSTGMFFMLSKLAEIDGMTLFDTSEVTDMYAMFYKCSELTSLDLSSFDTESVGDMSFMFSGCQALTSLDLSSFDTTCATDMEKMFSNCSSLKTIYVDGGKWSIEVVESSSDMFSGCTSLKGGNGFTYDFAKVDKTYAKINTKAENGYLTDVSAKYNPPLMTGGNFNAAIKGLVSSPTTIIFDLWSDTYVGTFTWDNGTDVTADGVGYVRAFQGADGTTVYVLTKGTKFVLNENSAGMFYQLSELTAIEGMNLFDTSSVTEMHVMFSGCSSLTSLDLSSFNTANMTYMQFMFNGCSSLKSLDLSSFNTANVTYMEDMFYGCSGLTSLTFPATFTTANVENMSSMFYKCSKLTSLDLSLFNTAKVTNMASMFVLCSGLTSLTFPATFTTANVEDMSSMFDRCSGLTSLDLSLFNTAKVTNMKQMFYKCSLLETIYVDPAKWSTANVTSSDSMFAYCTALKGGNGFAFDENTVDNTYAVINTKTTDGYLTDVHVEDYTLVGNGASLRSKLNSDEKGISHSTVRKIVFGYYDDYAGKFGTWESAYADMTVNGNGSGHVMAFAADEFDADGNDTVYILSDSKDRKIYLNADSRSLFSNYEAVTSIEGWECVDFSNVTTMSGMFNGCKVLEKLDFSGMNAPNLVDVEAMFNGCENLKSVDFSGSDLSGLKDMLMLFTGAAKLETVDFSNCKLCKSGVNATAMFCSVVPGPWAQVLFHNDGSDVDFGTSLKAVDFTGTNIEVFTDVTAMFCGDRALENIFITPDQSFAADAEDDQGVMFSLCSSLPGYDSASVGISKAKLVKNGGYLTDARSLIPGPELNEYKLHGSKIVFDTWEESSHLPEGVESYADLFTWEDGVDLTAAGNGYTRAFYVENEGGSIGATYVLTLGDKIVLNPDSSFTFSGMIITMEISGLELLDTSNVISFEGMFQNMMVVGPLDVSSFDMSSAKNLNHMFANAGSLRNDFSIDLTGWEVKPTDMGGMFRFCPTLKSIDLSGFDTSEVTDMSCLFEFDYSLTKLDLSSFNTSKVTDMSKMFCCDVKADAKAGPIIESMAATFEENGIEIPEVALLNQISIGKGWTVANVTSSGDMFAGCPNLPNYPEDPSKVTAADLDATRAHEGVDANGVKGYLGAIAPLMSGSIFNDAISKLVGLDQLTDLFFEIWSDEKHNKAMGFVWGEGTDVATVDGCVQAFKSGTTVYVLTKDDRFIVNKNAERMFKGMSKLTSLNVSMLDTRDVMKMQDMFNGCSSLKSLDLSMWNTESLTNIWAMFYDCSSLESIKFADDTKGTAWDTSKVTTMQATFNSCPALKSLDLSCFDFSNVTDMLGLFAMTPTLSEIIFPDDVDMSSVTNMSLMFAGCALETIDLSGWKLNPDGVNGFGMFCDPNYVGYPVAIDFTPPLKTVNLTGIDLSLFADTDLMFAGDTLLTTIISDDFGGFDNAESSDNMFSGCTALKGGNGFMLAEEAPVVDKTYAKINTASVDGYLTHPADITPILARDGITQKVMAGEVVIDGYLTKMIFDLWDNTVSYTNFEAAWEDGVDVTNDGSGWVRMFYVKEDGALYFFTQGTKFVLPDYCSNMFAGLFMLESIEGTNLFDTTRVTDMSGMFNGCSGLKELYLTSFDTSKVTNMEYMFHDMSNVENIWIGDGWTVKNVTDSDNMFAGCPELPNFDADYTDATRAHEGLNAEGTLGYLGNVKKSDLDVKLKSGGKFNDAITDLVSAKSLTKIVFDLWSDEKHGAMGFVWGNGTDVTADGVGYVRAFKGADGTTVYVLTKGTKFVFNTDCEEMFAYLGNLTAIEGLRLADTSAVTSMEGMFDSDALLTELDLSSFDTSSVTKTKCMFCDCASLKTIYVDPSKWDLSGVKGSDGGEMFIRCTAIEGAYGFAYADNEETDKDTATYAVINTKAKNGYLTHVADITPVLANNGITSKVNTSGIIKGDLTKMIFDLWDKKGNYANFITAAWEWEDGVDVTNDGSGWVRMFYVEEDKALYFFTQGTKFVLPEGCSGMFAGLWFLTEIKGTNLFDTTRVTDMSGMFNGCSGLTALDLTSFDTSNVMNMEYMFHDMSNVEKILIGDGWTVENVSASDYMFKNTPKLPNYVAGIHDKAKAYEGAGGYLGNSTPTDPATEADKAVLLPGCTSSDGSPSPNYRSNIFTGHDKAPDPENDKRSLLLPGTTRIIFAKWDDHEKYEAEYGVTFDWKDEKAIDVTVGSTGLVKAFKLGDPNAKDGIKPVDGENDEYEFGMYDGETVIIFTLGTKFNANPKMGQMFYALECLCQIDGLELIDTSNVTDMSLLFYDCDRALSTLDLSTWDVSNVTSMKGMFANCQKLTTLKIADEATGKKWNTENVTDMSHMFNFCMGLESASFAEELNVSSVTDMSYMFAFCPLIESYDLTKWDVSHVVDMTSMFDAEICFGEIFYHKNDEAFKALKEDDSMKGDHFFGTTTKTIDITGWDLASLKYAEEMFGAQICLRTIYATIDFNDENALPNLENADRMFINCATLIGQNGTNYDSNFTGKDYARLDLVREPGDVREPGYFTNKKNEGDYNHTGTWETSLIGNIANSINYNTFADKEEGFYPEPSDISAIIFGTMEDICRIGGGEILMEWTTFPDLTVERNGLIRALVMNMDGQTVLFIITAEGDKIFLGAGQDMFFANFENLAAITTVKAAILGMEGEDPNGLAMLDTSKATTFAFMFEHCGLTEIVIPASWNTSKVENMERMFFGCENLTSVTFPSTFNTSAVTGEKAEKDGTEYYDGGFSSMFKNSELLAEINGLKYFDTENVLTFRMMFNACTSLTSLDLSAFSFKSVTSMEGMFEECCQLQTLKLPTTTQESKNLKSLQGTFSYCLALESVDFSKFDFSNVEELGMAFGGCCSITSIEFPNDFKADKVLDFSGLFDSCFALTKLDLGAWTTESACYMNAMFAWNFALKSLDISNFHTENVEEMALMFAGTMSLEKIVLPATFVTTKCENFYGMFSFDYEEDCEVDLAELGIVLPTPVLKTIDLSAMTFGEDDLCFEKMFYKNSSVETIWVTSAFEDAIDAANKADEESTLDMFTGCTSLVGLNGFAYADNTDTDNKDGATYAKINTAAVAGYLSYNFGSAIKPEYMNLSLDGQIGVMVYMSISDVDNLVKYLGFNKATGEFDFARGVKLLFKMGDTVKTFDSTDAVTVKLGGNDCYQFLLKVNPDQMNCKIEIYLADAKGTPLTGTVYTTSVVTYANKVLSLENGGSDMINAAQVEGLSYGVAVEQYNAACNLIKAMLDYGTAAEIYNGTGSSTNRPNKGVDGAKMTGDVDLAEGLPVTGAFKQTLSNDSIEFVGFNLDLASDSAIRIYFRLTGDDAEAENADATVSEIVKASNGTLYQIDTKALVTTVGEDTYVVSISGIPAAYIDKAYQLSVSNEAGTEIAVIEVNMLAYVEAIIADTEQPVALRNLMATLYYYNQAANAFFEPEA